ncbi:MAG: NAD-dependent dehydratase [Lacunisphaera sp.]|nr:NAD-dependent dehydratase [Lacunisphaera sp.]
MKTLPKVLVTGAAGFIGSHTVDLLLAQGHEVIGVDNFRTGHAENLRAARGHPRWMFREQDCAAPGVLDALAAETRPEAIIHLAALVSVPESIANPAENDRLNLHATRLVAAAARAHGVKRIVFASSAAVYGTNHDLPLTEDSACAPLSPYGLAKLESEKLLLGLSRAQGITVRCQRYFNVFGPRQDPSSPYSGVISLFSRRLREGVPPTIHGDGEQSRDFIYVGDVAQANLIAATARGLASGVANICTGEAVSLNTLWAMLCTVLDRQLTPLHGPPRAGDIRHSLGAPGKAARDLDFRATTPLVEGLKALRA